MYHIDFVLQMYAKYNCGFGSNVNLVYVLCFKGKIKLNENNKIVIIVENDHILYYRYGVRHLNEIPHGIPQTDRSATRLTPQDRNNWTMTDAYRHAFRNSKYGFDSFFLFLSRDRNAKMRLVSVRHIHR